MVGERFNSLTVLKELKDRNKNGHILYSCKCDCGNIKTILGASIRSGSTKSCGCLVTKTNGKHLKEKSKIYKTWIGIKTRCFNKNSNIYKNYGGRGISMCETWKDFNVFYKDMGDVPNGMSIDRIDVNGDYKKSNCKWSNHKEQSRNKRNNNFITYKGTTKCLTEWCEELNMPLNTFSNRLKRGWSIEKTIETKVRKIKK